MTKSFSLGDEKPDAFGFFSSRARIEQLLLSTELPNFLCLLVSERSGVSQLKIILADLDGAQNCDRKIYWM